MLRRPQPGFVGLQTVLDDGLPIYATGHVSPREPDVGIMYEWVEDVTLYWPDGKHELPEKVLEKVTVNEMERIEEEILGACFDEYDA